MNEERYIEKKQLRFPMIRIQATAPKVVAKGKGKIAENILEKAKEHDVPIQEDPTFSRNSRATGY